MKSIRSVVILVVGLAVAFPLWPQSLPQEERPSAQHLREALEDLKKRMADLEAQLAVHAQQQPGDSQKPATAPPADPPAVSPVASSLPETSGGDPVPARTASRLDRLNVRGFGDVYHSFTKAGATANSFGLGQLDIFATSQISSRLSVLLETVVEADEHNEVHVEPERVLLRYRHNDFLNVDTGRFHSSLGFYNTTYHHGAWFQTSISRPFLFAFEDNGGVLPIHNVGVRVHGLIPSGPLGLKYIVEVGNGRSYWSPETPPVQANVDENNRKSLNISILSMPRRWSGLEFGLSAYRDDLRLAAIPRVRQQILTTHVVYRRARWESLNEAVLLRHQPSAYAISAPAATSFGFYNQISYRIGAAWRPYFRYEFLRVPPTDPLFGASPRISGRRRATMAGLRYDLSESVSLKYEVERISWENRRSQLQSSLQLSFTF